jgi:hypothetical protein
MRRPPWIVAAALVLLFATASHAQVLFPTYGGFGQRQGVYFHVRNGPLAFTYVAGAYGVRFGPAYPVVPWYYGPYGIPINPYGIQPPIIIQNIVQPLPPVPLIAGPNRPAVIPADFDEPPPRAVPRPGKLGPAPKPKGVAVVPEIAKPRPANRADADHIAETGRKAFADGQFGRALELFRRAAEITPNEPSAHYLISQAQFALGKYREAVSAIAAGMALRADWSEARFKSRDLYWKTPAAFDEHLAVLRKAVEAFPDDPALNFLLGHQLWFDGKHEEATPLIQKARAIGKDRTPAADFVLR